MASPDLTAPGLIHIAVLDDDPDFRTYIEDFLRGALVSRITDVLGSNMTSILDLPKMFDELSAGMRAKLQADFAAMGIALKQFMIVSLSPTEETAKAIDERGAMGAVGNMDSYMKYQAAKSMRDASNNPGGEASTGVGLGAGMGMGAGMAGMIANAMNTPQQSQPQAAPATSNVMTLDEAAAYLRVAPADVQAMIDAGELKAKKIGSEYRIGKDVIDAFLAS